MHIACLMSPVEVVEALLATGRAGTLLDEDSSGETPAQYATRNRHAYVLSYVCAKLRRGGHAEYADQLAQQRPADGKGSQSCCAKQHAR